MTVKVWRYGDPQPEGVDVVYVHNVASSFGDWLEWRLTERGWYCHTAYGAPPNGSGAYASWRTITSLWGDRVCSRVVPFGECIRRDA